MESSQLNFATVEIRLISFNGGAVIENVVGKTRFSLGGCLSVRIQVWMPHSRVGEVTQGRMNKISTDATVKHCRCWFYHSTQRWHTGQTASIWHHIMPTQSAFSALWSAIKYKNINMRFFPSTNQAKNSTPTVAWHICVSSLPVCVWRINTFRWEVIQFLEVSIPATEA